MAHTTGTATDFFDMFSKIRSWMTTTAAWTELKWTAPAAGTRGELWIQGIGGGASQPVIAGFRTFRNATNSYFGIEMRCSLDYDAALDFDSQQSPGPTVWFNIWDAPMTYWFYANTRRLIMVVKCGTAYISGYVGCFLPFALPDEYPFPLYVGGNYRDVAVYNVDDSANRMIADPGATTAYFHRRDVSGWRRMSNHGPDAGSNWYADFANTTTAFLWPARNYPSNGWSYDDPNFGTKLFSLLRPVAGGARPIYQCHIVDPVSESFVGALDGVFYLPGHGLVPEQEIVSSGRTFRIFQNITRSTERDFFCVEEI